MVTNLKPLGAFLVEIYAWLLSIFFGMVLLDIIYSRLVPEARTAFSSISDFLLIFGFATFCSAVVAIAFSMQSKAARNLLIASLLVMLFEFLIPVLLAPFTRGGPESPLGPWLRILPIAAASILAFAGIYQYHRGK